MLIMKELIAQLPGCVCTWAEQRCPTVPLQDLNTPPLAGAVTAAVSIICVMMPLLNTCPTNATRFRPSRRPDFRPANGARQGCSVCVSLLQASAISRADSERCGHSCRHRCGCGVSEHGAPDNKRAKEPHAAEKSVGRYAGKNDGRRAPTLCYNRVRREGFLRHRVRFKCLCSCLSSSPFT